LDVVAASMMAIELQEQLPARERDLDSRECILMVWEDGLAAFEHALGKARMECDGECDQTEAIQ
jgi:hypothetical protein